MSRNKFPLISVIAALFFCAAMVGCGSTKKAAKLDENFANDSSKSAKQESPLENLTAEEYYKLGIEARKSEDYGTAVEYLLKASNMGYADAHLKLGWCYEYGKGVPQSYSKAYDWYQKAVAFFQKEAKQGNAYAQYRLGDCYASGTGVEKDEKKAFEWYQKASETGYAKAQWSLGYATGMEKVLKKTKQKHLNGIKKRQIKDTLMLNTKWGIIS